MMRLRDNWIDRCYISFCVRGFEWNIRALWEILDRCSEALTHAAACCLNIVALGRRTVDILSVLVLSTSSAVSVLRRLQSTQLVGQVAPSLCIRVITVSYSAPNVLKAALSSFTAVGTSSKFSAEIAHRACFCASMIASSSVL